MRLLQSSVHSVHKSRQIYYILLIKKSKHKAATRDF